VFDYSRVALYEIGGVNIGRPAYAMALKNYKVYITKYILPLELLMRLLACTRDYLMGMKIVESLTSEDEGAIYLRDLAYSDSILFDLCMKNQVGVYAIAYPQTMTFYKSKHITSVSVRKLAFPKFSITDKQYNDYMNGRLEDPRKHISYYSPEKHSLDSYFLPKNQEKKIALIYAHSFSDAQLAYGYDGFTNIYDWLIFTVDFLIKNDVEILVKAHPNFWSIGHESKIVEVDQKVWGFIKKKYENSNLVKFIDKPIDNKFILEKMRKSNTIVISHHGNAVAEAAYFGYKTISSSCSTWGDDYYNFSNTWQSKYEYVTMLSNIDVLEYTDEKKLKNFVADRFYKNQYDEWWDVVANEAGVSVPEIVKNPEIINKDNFNDYSQSIERLSILINQMVYE